MTEIVIRLDRAERRQLMKSAKAALREPGDHARFIIRSVLLGELPPASTNQEKNTSAAIDRPHAGVDRTDQ